MSSRFEHTYLTKNGLQGQLLNTLVGNHDLCCKCDEPLTHLAVLIFEKAKPTNFTEKEKTIIKKCLGEGDGDGTTTGDAIDGLGDGDLEKLFAEDGDDG